jgi:hypothetical protein
LATDDLRASTDIGMLARLEKHARLSCRDQSMQGWRRLIARRNGQKDGIESRRVRRSAVIPAEQKASRLSATA